MMSAPPVPAPATFSVVGNPDLSCQILQHTSDRTSSGLSPTDLVNVALTWSAFREPALDSLWRSLTSFIPLLKLIPGLTAVNGLYTLLGPLPPSDFARFDYHGARVRCMKFTNPEDLLVDTSVFIRIAQEHRGPMLPLLQQLRIRSSAHLNPSLPLLLAPTLHYIHLSSDEGVQEGAAFATLLSMAAHSFPAVLDHLVIEGTFSPTIFALIPRFDHLRTLDMRNIDQSIEYTAFLSLLETVSSSTDITSLLLRDIPGHTWESPSIREAAFPGLKMLQIRGGFEFIAQLIGRLQTSDLQNINLDFTDGPTINGPFEEVLDEHWGSLFDRIASRWQSSLVRIKIKLGNNAPHTQFLHLFQGICSLANLREFRLLGSPVIGFGEADVLALAIGCPSLEILGLVTALNMQHWDPVLASLGRVLRQNSLPSINTLIDLANHCRCLRELEISLDLDREIETEIPSFFAHGLEDLTIVAPQSPEQLGWIRSNGIAKFLDTTFPALKSVRGSDGARDGWEAVDSLVQLFQAARVHERRRMNFP
ncbi:hypothetical protein DFH09DRAFT_1375887 [Mycena vulgaris]|nr:hypothetical protein DFH09DRAFT_1375887 [Mycena vulgaris]